MEEYLPPIVTKLKADLSDLVRGLAEARAMVRDFAAGSHKELVDAMADAGRDGGALFGNEFKKTSSALMRDLERDVGRDLLNESKKIMSNAGQESGRSFAGSFSGMMMPLLIGALVLLAPAIVTLVAGAISAGVSLGFIGLGAFLLREQPGLIAAAINFKNTISAVFKDAATPLLGPLIGALNILSGVVRTLAPEFKQMFTNLAGIIEPLATGLGQMITATMPGLNEMLGHPEIMLAFAQGLVHLGEGMSTLFHEIATHGPEIADFMSDFMQGLGNLIAGIGYLIGFMSVTYEKIDALHNKAVQGGWDTPWKAVATGVGIALSALGHATVAVGDFLVGIYNRVVNWLGKAGDFIGAWVGRAVDYFTSIPGKIWAALVALPGVLKRAAVTAFDAFFYWTSYGITKVLVFLFTLPQTLENLALQGYMALVGWVQRGATEIERQAQTLPDRIGNALSRMWNTAVDWVSRTYTDVNAWIYRMVMTVVAFVESLPSRARKGFDDFLSFAKNFLTNMVSSWYQSGKNLVMGLVHGVEDAVQAGIDVVERAMKRIYEGAKKALHIKSPSALFAQLGSYTIQGYIQGLLSQSSALASAWGRLPMPTPAFAGAGGSMTALAASVAPSGRGGRPSDGAMLEATFSLDGVQFLNAIVPVAQKQKDRTGTTGLS